MAGVAGLAGEVRSALSPIVRNVGQAVSVGSNIYGAYKAVEDSEKLLKDALNEDDYLRYGTTEDYLKQLSSGVVDLAGDIPVLGEAMSVLGTPLKMAIDGFIGDVLAPVFLDTDAERKAIERRMEWENFVGDASEMRYGVRMNPAQYQEAKFNDLVNKTDAKNADLSRQMASDAEEAKRMGYADAESMYRGLRGQNKADIKAFAESRGMTPMELKDRLREEAKTKRMENKRKSSRIPTYTQPPATYSVVRDTPFPVAPRPSITGMGRPSSTMIGRPVSQVGQMYNNMISSAMSQLQNSVNNVGQTSISGLPTGSAPQYGNVVFA
jgi:hypothetical protein